MKTTDTETTLGIFNFQFALVYRYINRPSQASIPFGDRIASLRVLANSQHPAQVKRLVFEVLTRLFRNHLKPFILVALLTEPSPEP
jgi:hypothetical protein